MNLSAEKLEIIQKICEIQDNDLIDMVKKIISLPAVSKSDWWNQVSQTEIQSIDRGLKDMEVGRVQPHDNIKRKYEKWLKD